LIEGPLAEEILAGTVRKGSRIEVRCEANGELTMLYER
jgi:hypothetical protein